MATTKPRITVTLEPEHYAVLAEMAAISKSSMSSILAEIAAEAMPVFARVVKLAKEAETAKASIGERVKELATEAELQMLPLARDALKTFDMFDDAIMKAIAAAKESEGEAGKVDASGSPVKRSKRGADKAGLEWWNGLTESDRAHWMRVAGSAVPADAWKAFQRGTAK